MREDKTSPAPGPVSEALLGAAMDVLGTDGWDGLSLEAVARRAGMSRVTAWRQAGSKDHLVDELLGRLAADYRNSLWPILTASGSGAQRLEAALAALCDVADRHLPLLLASDTVFHRAHDQTPPSVRFTEPLVRLIRDGVSDHSLDPPEDCETMGLIVFTTVAWPYVHLRGRHDWDPGKARGLLIRLVMGGLRGDGRHKPE